MAMFGCANFGQAAVAREQALAACLGAVSLHALLRPGRSRRIRGTSMRLIHTAPLVAAILLAACGGDADTGDGAAGEQASAGDTIKLQPGQYRASYEMLEFNMPDASDEVKQRAQAQMGGAAEVAKPITYCLTPEQAAANGAEQMAKRMAEGNCTVARFDVSGGSISAEMQCTGPTGAMSHVLMDGQMTTTSSTMTMTDESEIPGLGKVQTKTRVTAERLGDCPA